MTPGDESNALDVGSLSMDSSVTMEWTFESMVALIDGEGLPSPVEFLGEATDSYGDRVAFLVDSTKEGE